MNSRKQQIIAGALAATTLLSSVAAAQKAPEIRKLGPVKATAHDSISLLGGIRHLPNGGVLVNDILRRRVMLLDADLKLVSIVADTTPGTANAYGPRGAGLVAFRGDSTLFIDAASQSMLVIDGKGAITRVMAVPRSQDAGMLATSALGGMGFDGSRLVYRGMNLNFRAGGPMGGNPGAASNGPTIQMPTIPDTMPIVRVDLATRTVDTAAFYKISQPKTNMNRSEDGRMSITMEINPLPVVDDYAVLADGRLAVVRGKDYHVDFVDASGKITSAPKIPFEWKRLTDEEKVAFLDSTKAARDRLMAAAGDNAGAKAGAAIGAAMGGMAGGGAGPMVITSSVRSSANGEPPMRGSAGGPGNMQISAPTVTYVSPDQLPDYQPAFFGNQVRGDMDGNVWVRIIPPKPIVGGAVYDVINGKGELIDRVQLPPNRSIAGFGTGGIVYLSGQEGSNTVLERATLR